MEDLTIPMGEASDVLEVTEPTTSTTANNLITKVITRGPIVFSRLYRNTYQKPKTITLEVKQLVNTVASYPTQRVDSNLQDTIFPIEDFKIEPKLFPSVETRVAWILVPETTTEEQALVGIANYPDAVVYRILSNEPILDSNQEFAIAQGLKTKSEFADTQVCRYPANHKDAGKLILDKAGNPMYRRTLYKTEPTADIDLRFGKSPVFMSPKIAAELSGASVFTGQTV